MIIELIIFIVVLFMLAIFFLPIALIWGVFHLIGLTGLVGTIVGIGLYLVYISLLIRVI